MSAEQLEKYVVFLKPNETKMKQVSKQGLLYFKSVYGVVDYSIREDAAEKDNNNRSSDSEVIELLKEQLRIKDEQIATLLEQNRNFQVLLKAEQDKLLSPPKSSFIKRFFSKK